MAVTDDKVLELKKLVDKKRADVKSVKTFQPITTCMLTLDGVNYNLHACTLDQLKYLYLKLHLLYGAMLECDCSPDICGFSIVDWKSDVQSKIAILLKKNKEKELRDLEKKLDSLLSNEKKTEIELDQIEKLLNG